MNFYLEFWSLLKANASKIIPIATIIGTIIFVARVLHTVRWNFDLALAVMTNMNLIAQLIITGSVSIALALSSLVSTSFFSHKLGEEVPRKTKILGSFFVAGAYFLPFWISFIFFGYMILRIILNCFINRKRRWALRIENFFVKNSLSWTSLISVGVIYLLLPIGVLISGNLITTSSQNYKGLLVPGATQTLVVNVDRSMIRYVQNSDISTLETTFHPDPFWSSSLASLTIHAFTASN